MKTDEKIRIIRVRNYYETRTFLQAELLVLSRRDPIDLRCWTTKKVIAVVRLRSGPMAFDKDSNLMTGRLRWQEDVRSATKTLDKFHRSTLRGWLTKYYDPDFYLCGGRGLTEKERIKYFAHLI